METGIDWMTTEAKTVSPTMDEARAFLEWLRPHGGPCSVCAKNAAGVFCGRIVATTADAMDGIEAMTRKGALSIWTSLQQLHNDAADEQDEKQKGKANEGQVKRIVNLALDFDNEPAVAGHAATDEEHERALRRAQQCIHDLVASGLPQPLSADSGNGALLIFPINLSPKHKPLLVRLAEALKNKYDGDGVNLDAGVLQDGSRIIGVPGTINAGKKSAADRPHRMRTILAKPERAPMSEEAFLAWAEAWIGKHPPKHGASINFAKPRKHSNPTADGTEQKQSSSTSSPNDNLTPITFHHSDNHAVASDENVRHFLFRAKSYVECCGRVGEGERNKEAFKLAGNLFDKLGAEDWQPSHADILAIMTDWNMARCVPPLDHDELSKAVQSGMTNGRNRQPSTLPSPSVINDDSTPSVAPDDADGMAKCCKRPFYLPSDMGNAEAFADVAFDKLRWVTEWQAWIAWDGKRWARSSNERTVGLAMEVAKYVLPALAARIAADKDRAVFLQHCGRSQSLTKIESMVKLSRSLLAIDAKQLDADPLLFNCSTGTIDLRTGQHREHRRENLITKIANVGWGNSACPSWLSFLNEVFADPQTGKPRQDLIAFVKRAAGYSLSGGVEAEAMFILSGRGGNGKSTFVSTIQNMLGDYGLTGQQSLLLADRYKSNSEDETNLFGARFVSISETGSLSRFDDAKLKRLVTHSKPIRARRLHENSFEFLPTHKIWLDCNDLPRLEGSDDALRRRLKLVPFDVTIAPERRDLGLTARLLAESSGILHWMLEGGPSIGATGSAILRSSRRACRHT